MFFYFIMILIFLPSVILFPLRIKNKRKYKQLKGITCIVACNHMSFMDPIMIDIKFKKKFRILAKVELFKKKFNSACLKSFGAIPVDRQTVDLSAIKMTLREIEKKHDVLIFPQGTRAKTPIIEDGSAKMGVAMFAVRTGTPVVPMMFTRKLKVFRLSKLIVGDPIYPDTARAKDREYITEFADLVTKKMNEILEGEDKNENERF